MGNPAAVVGDLVQGQCATHQMPGPTGSPVPAGVLPFSAPLTLGAEPTVLIGGKPALVAGASGFNTPPHVPPLHASDPHMVPTTQEARVLVGSPTVLFGGKQAAFSGCQTAICFQQPGQLVGSAATVLVG